ncbi:Hypothetical predicted protein, partial [Drosophila guanche]
MPLATLNQIERKQCASTVMMEMYETGGAVVGGAVGDCASARVESSLLVVCDYDEQAEDEGIGGSCPSQCHSITAHCAPCTVLRAPRTARYWQHRPSLTHVEFLAENQIQKPIPNPNQTVIMSLADRNRTQTPTQTPCADSEHSMDCVVDPLQNQVKNGMGNGNRNCEKRRRPYNYRGGRFLCHKIVQNGMESRFGSQSPRAPPVGSAVTRLSLSATCCDSTRTRESRTVRIFWLKLLEITQGPGIRGVLSCERSAMANIVGLAIKWSPVRVARTACVIEEVQGRASQLDRERLVIDDDGPQQRHRPMPLLLLYSVMGVAALTPRSGICRRLPCFPF